MSAAGLLGLALALVTNGPGRREAVVLGAAAVSSKPVTIASAATAKPVLVLGAGGGTGRACVAALLAKGIPCVATSRTGDLSFDAAELLTVAAADVTDASALSQFSALACFRTRLKPASVCKCALLASLCLTSCFLLPPQFAPGHSRGSSSPRLPLPRAEMPSLSTAMA